MGESGIGEGAHPRASAGENRRGPREGGGGVVSERSSPSGPACEGDRRGEPMSCGEATRSTAMAAR